MKVIVKQTLTSGSSVTRTFDKLSDIATDSALKTFAKAYIALTVAATTKASKVVTTDLALDD